VATLKNSYGLTPEEMPVIGIDFDGTIAAKAEYPVIGLPIPGAIGTINEWYDEGLWIVIHSCREGQEARDMIEWLDYYHINYHGVNENLEHRIKQFGKDPRKLGVDINIDDKDLNQLGPPMMDSDWDRFKFQVNMYMFQLELMK